MYQGLGQMLTMFLQHHQGFSETPKCAYVIYGQPLIRQLPTDVLRNLCKLFKYVFYISQGVSKLEHKDNDNYEEAESHHQPHLE